MDGFDYDGYYNAREQHAVAMRLILSGLCLVAIAASSFLSITILRFKRLRTRTNMYILNLAIINSIYTIGIFIFLTFNLFESRILEKAIYVQFYFILVHVVFAFLLALDWFLTATKPNWMVHYHKFYKFVFLFIYLCFVFEIIVTFSVATSDHNFKVAIFVAVYFFVIILLILLNILKGIVKMKTDGIKSKYGFVVANITLFSFIPCVFHHFVYLVTIFYDYTRTFEAIFYFITFLPYIVWICHPILVVYILGYLNVHFKMAYHKSFKRLSNYSQDDLEELHQEETEIQ